LASSLGVEFHSYRRLLLYFSWVVETGAKTLVLFIEGYCLSSDFYRNDKHGRQFTGVLDSQ